MNRTLSLPRLFCITSLTLAAVLLWDVSGLDLAAAQAFGTPYGFPWRFSAELAFWMHEVPRYLSWTGALLLLASIYRPVWLLRRLNRSERTQLAVTLLASVLAVSALKSISRTSCPYDLQAFGGVAAHVSHWAWRLQDGGPGGCFPAGHASAAFAYLGGYFAFRRSSPTVARIWLAAALAVGALLGLVQQLRGAHYMSHTLWTAWICWTTALAIELTVRHTRRPAVPSGAGHSTLLGRT